MEACSGTWVPRLKSHSSSAGIPMLRWSLACLEIPLPILLRAFLQAVSPVSETRFNPDMLLLSHSREVQFLARIVKADSRSTTCNLKILSEKTQCSSAQEGL